MSAVIPGYMNQPVIGANPNGAGVKRRWTYGVHHAESIGHGLIDVLGGDRVQSLAGFRGAGAPGRD